MKIFPGKRFKPYIIGIHILLWVVLFLVPLFFIETANGRDRYMVYGWGFQFLMACYFYYNYFWLIPRFFLQSKIWQYSLMVVLGYFMVSCLYALFYYLTFNIYEHHHTFSFWRTLFFPLYPAIMFFALSSALRLSIEWFNTERQKKEMKAEKLSSELAFLKSQVNPHFLFNILNSICSLARKKSDETENAIIKLSKIMRYMLEDSRDEKVSLEKEVEYLNSYIELQRMRLSDSVKIDFTIAGKPGQILIEPLLLIPFVENAFKHGISYHDISEIAICLKTGNNSLFFSVKNNIIRPVGESVEQGSGIGLKNVTRRLELLYPENHRLKIKDDGGLYLVELEIKF